MCIIIYKPKGKSVPLERLFNAKDRNPHGFGVSWAVKKKLHIFKTMDFDEFLEKYSKINRYDCVIHFRYATQGKKEKINCHPFRINDDYVMAHNGTIRDIDGTSHDVSDSRAFAHSYVRPMTKIKKDFISSKNGKRWMTSIISPNPNKLCFMNKYGTPTFINGDLGHWSMGCWYSNDGYKRREPIFTSKPTIKSAKGYAYLARKPKAQPKDITQSLPIGYGKLRTGRSLIDDIQDEMWEDWEQEDNLQNQVDEYEQNCNSSEGQDCSEDEVL